MQVLVIYLEVGDRSSPTITQVLKLSNLFGKTAFRFEAVFNDLLIVGLNLQESRFLKPEHRGGGRSG